MSASIHNLFTKFQSIFVLLCLGPMKVCLFWGASTLTSIHGPFIKFYSEFACLGHIWVLWKHVYFGISLSKAIAYLGSTPINFYPGGIVRSKVVITTTDVKCSPFYDAQQFRGFSITRCLYQTDRRRSDDECCTPSPNARSNSQTRNANALGNGLQLLSYKSKTVVREQTGPGWPSSYLNFIWRPGKRWQIPFR